MNGNTIYHAFVSVTITTHYFGSDCCHIRHVHTLVELGASKSRLWAYGITETKPYRKNEVHHL